MCRRGSECDHVRAQLGDHDRVRDERLGIRNPDEDDEPKGGGWEGWLRDTTEQSPTPLAVRWCPRCRVRQPLEPEWGSISGLLVCSLCTSQAADVESYNFPDLDPIDDVDPTATTQRVRLAHADVVTPKSAIRRDFGQRQGQRQPRERPPKPDPVPAPEPVEVRELPPWLDDESPAYVRCPK
jgi:hypothetical protein